jgi:histidinol-phosphatase (PHP family)
MADSCRAAVAAGVTEIAFTDHVDHQPKDMGYAYYKPDDYFRSLESVRQEFSDRLTILAGAEVDFHTDTADEVGRFMDRYGQKYDFVIGSVHYGPGGAIIFPEEFAGRTLDDVFLPYFDQVQSAVATGWFDTIGHLDIPKRYAPRTHRTYDPLRYRGRLQEIFATMIEKSVAFEINTSGLRQAPKTSMPGPAIVRWYAEAGGKRITTGTDSHAAQTVGAGVAKTLDMLTLCGIEHVASFRNRSARLVPISELRPTAPPTSA